MKNKNKLKKEIKLIMNDRKFSDLGFKFDNLSREDIDFIKKIFENKTKERQ
jgi:hypothetical protein